MRSHEDVLGPVTAPLGAAAKVVFRAAANLRDGRTFHPRGVTLRARLSVPDDGGVTGSELLTPGRHADALVRLSRGIGLRPPLPDVLGLSVKVPDAYGAGLDQDILLASSADRPLLHHVLVPAVGWVRPTYSSILVHQVGDQRLLLGGWLEAPDGDDPVREEEAVRAVGDGRLRVRLAVASPMGRWRPVADLEPFDVVPAAESERLRFDPWNTGGGIRPLGPINRIRAAAYEGSRQGRDAA